MKLVFYSFYIRNSLIRYILLIISSNWKLQVNLSKYVLRSVGELTFFTKISHTHECESLILCCILWKHGYLYECKWDYRYTLKARLLIQG